MLRASGATRQRGPGLNGNRWSLDQLHLGLVELARPFRESVILSEAKDLLELAWIFRFAQDDWEEG